MLLFKTCNPTKAKGCNLIEFYQENTKQTFIKIGRKGNKKYYRAINF
jgi:hypothetical protein